MATPQEFHRLLALSAARGDQQTFLSVAPDYFVSLGEQIIQNLLYQIQRYNSITKRIWLFGVAFMITVMAATAMVQQHKPTYITTHMPTLISPHATLISLAVSMAIVSLPLGILEMIKAWLYHLVRKTDSTRQSMKRKKNFANAAWEAASGRPDPMPYIEAEAYRGYSKVLKSFSRFRH